MQAFVIARVVEGAPMEQVLPLVKPEAAKVWELYNDEKLRTIHYISDMSGVVMLWEISSLEALEAELQKLPMIEAGMLVCEVIPIKPYTGFTELFAS